MKLSNSVAGYVEHAEEINSLARHSLRLETQDSNFLSRKISLGLSFQAIELASKGILISLGEKPESIRKRHSKHEITPLLKHVEEAIHLRTEVEFRKYYDFLSWSPEIQGLQLKTTIIDYLHKHFQKGKTAKPRNYFYPDEALFAAPKPIQCLYLFAEYLIQMAKEISVLAIKI
ncbi:hypothetical protein ACSVIJ_16150 [Pseudomonas sp. NCHU5208]|uniref:hypothetical protein n=1 Tax=unclassified Pseudomonas TaxID=196821 RepID=UPI003F953E17